MNINTQLSTIIDNQPILNIGCIGHVAHGKSSVVYNLTGIKTIKHSAEIERNITINLGYANLRIYYDKINNNFINSNKKLDNNNYILCNHFSFVDCPGHQSFMATMLSGTEHFDIVFVLISINDTIPQPQTIAHVEILNHINVKNIIILLNKIDLIVDENILNKRLTELKLFINNYPILKSKLIIPISAQYKINMNYIINYLASITIPNISQLINKQFQMNILRSFNINKLGINIANIKGGVIGGTIKTGYICINDWIIILPGIVFIIKDRWYIRPIICKICSIQSDNTSLNIAYPGGLIALGLECDPALCKNNNLVGNIIYKFDKKNYNDLLTLNNIIYDFDMEITFINNKDNYNTLTDIYLLITSYLIKAKIMSTNNNNTLLRIITEKPIINDNSNISILHKTLNGIELFAKGNIIKSYKNISILLPTNIDNIYNQLNDINTINIDHNYHSNNFSFDNKYNNFDDIKYDILQYIKPKVIYKMSLPKLDFKIDSTRYIWINARSYIAKFNIDSNLDLTILIDQTNIKWLCFGKMIVEYFNYVYSSVNGLADIIDDRIIIHIKKTTKNKPRDVISKFINTFYICNICNSYTCRIGKILSQYMSICVLCNYRNIIRDEWIKQ